MQIPKLVGQTPVANTDTIVYENILNLFCGVLCILPRGKNVSNLLRLLYRLIALACIKLW